MPHETATITKDTWATFSARPAAHSIGGLVTVESNSSAHVPVVSIAAPPAFPGLSLAIPADVSQQIDALTRSALDGARLADLPAFEQLATETTFGPDAGRLAKAGLSRPLAASVARWGSALYHLGTRLADARMAAQWASDATGRAIERRGEVDATDLIFIRKRAGQWGGGGLCADWTLMAQDKGQRDGRSATLQRAPLVRPQGYLRAAQAYILISIPTATSMIFGAFQVMYFLVLVVTDHLSVTTTAQKVART